MDNFLSILSGFNSAHEEALMHGFYNALALGILCLVTAASYCLYIILSPFVKPLIWALLCGAVLFPFKLSLSTCVQSWFTSMEQSNKPILMNLLMTPLHLTDRFAEFLGSFIWKCKRQHLKFVGLPLSLAMFSCFVYSYSPTILSQLVCQLFSLVNVLTSFFISSCNFYLVLTVVTGYILVVLFYWSPEYSLHFHLACAFVWTVISLYVANIFGDYAVVTFYFFGCLLCVGFIYELAFILDHCDANQSSFANMLRTILHSVDPPVAQEVKQVQLEPNEDAEEAPTISRQASTESERTVKPKPKLLKSVTFGENADKWFPKRFAGSDYAAANRRSFLSDRNILKKIGLELRMTLELEDNKVRTSNYIYGMVYLCVGMVLWKHKWLVPILMVPIVYYLIKIAGSYFGLWELVYENYQLVKRSIVEWCTLRGQALVPINVHGLYKIALVVNQKVTEILKSSVDTVSTIAVIVGLLVFTSLTSMFLTFQVYGEGLHLLQVAGQLLNTTVMNNPDIDWIPQSWEDSINNVLDDAYTHGRDIISKGLKGFTKDFEPTKAEHLEKKVLELWDRLYQAWMMSSAENPTFIGPIVDPNAAYSVWENLNENLLKIPTNFFDVTSIKIFVQENIGIVTSILDSMWSIVKGNASVIFSLLTESLYVVIMSGSLLVNFVISMVVFFSTLFYLLSSSGKTYKPIEIATLYSPISCHKFAIALQEVVIGVFTVTFKLASFFGMWTWFVHNLFQVKVAYLPAVFAALLGAVPFLDPYFACLPATVELWFTRGPMTALIFFIFHFLASNIIVTDFYKEIKGGGHPYLTGLSIAGGVFCLGVEGAIFGPLLLCCIIVAINLGRRAFFTPTTEETLNTLKSQLDQLHK